MLVLPFSSCSEVVMESRCNMPRTMTILSDFPLLPSLTAQTQCLVKVWEKSGIKQNNPAAKSGKMKPKTVITFKEYINDTIKMPFCILSEDPEAARHCTEFEENIFKQECQ